MLRIFKVITASICLLLMSPAGLVVAHGDGASFELEQNEVLIDIGYTPEEFVAGARVRLDFDLYDLTENDSPPLEFTNVWLRLTQNGQVFFSGNLYNPVQTQTVATLQLPPAGDYELGARFYEGDSIVADAVFPVSVVPDDSVITADESEASLTPVWWFTLGGIIISTVVAAGVVFFAGLLTGRVVRKSGAAH